LHNGLYLQIKDKYFVLLAWKLLHKKEIDNWPTKVLIVGEYYITKQKNTSLKWNKLGSDKRFYRVRLFVQDEEVKYFFSAAMWWCNLYKNATQSRGNADCLSI